MIQWFPGHMMKTKNELSDTLKVIDIVIELLDARIPSSSLNPLFDEVVKNKPRLFLLTKATLADDYITKKWLKYFIDNNKPCLLIDALSGFNLKRISSTCKDILKDKLLKDQAKGLKARPLRAMIIGIPNVGKSTLINRLVNKKVTMVGNKPGVTKSLQWIRINKDLELLDTPGVLWPKFASEKQAYHLALTGAIKDEVLKKESLVIYLIEFIKKHYSALLQNKYPHEENAKAEDIIKQIGRVRGYLEEASETLFDSIIRDYRAGNLGRISLDWLENE